MLRHESRFVKAVIKSEFGDIVKKIVEVFLDFGTQTLEELLKNSELNEKSLRKGLVILVQHCIVSASFKPVDKSSVEIKAATDIDSSNGKRKKKGKQQKQKQKEAEKKKPVILYDINTEVIHHRQYKGKCVEISKREFGEIGGKIAQSFAVHGKLSKLHLSEAIKQFDDDEQDEEEGISAQALMQAFNAMVSAKYIKRSDTIEASGQKKQKKRLELEEKAEENMKKKKKNKGDKEVSSSRVNSAAFAVEKAKEKAEEELQDKHGVDGDAGDGDKGGRTSKDGLDKEVVWELSYERFGWDRKKGMIVQYVNEHVAPAAGVIVKHMLDQYPHSRRFRYPMLDYDRISDILEEAGVYSDAEFSTSGRARGRKRRRGELMLADEDLDEYLSEMQQATPHIMRLTPTGYVIEIEDILTDMKMRHSQAIAREKFGLVASRIIRILHESKRLEEKSIAEIAVAPAKKTRELLHKMLNEGFVGLQEIAKSSDRNPARTFYLWNTPTTRLFERLLDSFYFTASNLQARIRSENDSARSVVDKVRLDYSLSALETKTFNAWRTSATRLNHARGEILDLIFLFRDDDAL